MKTPQTLIKELCKKNSYEKTAQILNDKGYTTPKGREWKTHSVAYAATKKPTKRKAVPTTKLITTGWTAADAIRVYKSNIPKKTKDKILKVIESTAK